MLFAGFSAPIERSGEMLFIGMYGENRRENRQIIFFLLTDPCDYLCLFLKTFLYLLTLKTENKWL